jgi:hypothetical protein
MPAVELMRDRSLNRQIECGQLVKHRCIVSRPEEWPCRLRRPSIDGRGLYHFCAICCALRFSDWLFDRAIPIAPLPTAV